MIKTVVIGLWVCIIALGSLMAAIKVGSTPKPAAAEEQAAPTVDFDRTDVMSVPILADGKVDGYIISQLVYTVDSNVKKRLMFRWDCSSMMRFLVRCSALIRIPSKLNV